MCRNNDCTAAEAIGLRAQLRRTAVPGDAIAPMARARQGGYIEQSMHRPEFQRMLDQIREDDIVVVWKLDRLARSTRDLLETMETLRGAGGKFQSLSEPWADTTSHAGKMIMTIFAGIAEFERDLIRERTGAGREAAKKRGVLFGRPPKLTPDQRQLARRLVSEGKSVREIASVFNVHAATIYRLAYSTAGMAN